MLLDEGESFVEQFHLCLVLPSRWGRSWWKGGPLVDLLLPIFLLPARPHKARASPRLVHGLGVMSRWDKLPHHGPSHPNQYASFQLLLASQQSASYQFQTTSLLVKIQMPDKLQLFIPCSLLSTLQRQNILLPSQHCMWANVISDQNEQALEMS